MAITNFVWVELDRAIHKELNDTKFYIIWLLLMSAIFENKKWHKMYGKVLEKMKSCSTHSFKESEFNQSVSWSKDRKQSVDNGNVQIYLLNYKWVKFILGWIFHFDVTISIASFDMSYIMKTQLKPVVDCF